MNAHPDIAGLLRASSTRRRITEALAGPFSGRGVTTVLAPEARGFIVATMVADELGADLVLARRVGANHPGADVEIASGPTWRGEASHFQIRSDDIGPTTRAIVVDDWLTTGSTARALRDAVVAAGGTYLGCAAIMNKAEARVLDDLAAHTLIDFAALDLQGTD